MGAINYGTSKYITLGIRPYDEDGFLNDKDFMSDLENEYGIDLENDDEVTAFIQETIDDYYIADRDNAQSYIDKENFEYFKVTVEHGYYEGVYINIEPLFPILWNDYHERKQALDELKAMRTLLTNISGCGFVSCYPFWVTGYDDYKETQRQIKQAIKDMRQDIMRTMTYRQYKASGLTFEQIINA